MGKQTKRQRHLSGNPLKRIQQNNIKEQKKIKKPFPWKSVVIAVVVMVITLVAGSMLLSYFKDKNEVLSGSYVDEKNNIAVVTYPPGFFGTDEQMHETAELWREGKEFEKIVENPDGSMSVKMSMEKYEQVKSAIETTVGSMMLAAISDQTGISDVVPNEDYSLATVYINKDAFAGRDALTNCSAMMRAYQACNKLNSDSTIGFIFIDSATGLEIRNETYDMSGTLIFSEGEELIEVSSEQTEYSTDVL